MSLQYSGQCKEVKNLNQRRLEGWVWMGLVCLLRQLGPSQGRWHPV